MHSTRRINGMDVHYEPQHLGTLLQRMTDRDIVKETDAYTQNNGSVTRVVFNPVYFHGDRYTYRINLPRGPETLQARLGHARHERLVISPKFDPKSEPYQIIVERDTQKGRSRVYKKFTDRKEDQRTFKDDELSRLESYVRGMLPDDPVSHSNVAE